MRQAEEVELTRRILDCLKEVEVEAMGGVDATFRSSLRKSLSHAVQLAQSLLEEGALARRARFKELLHAAYKFLVNYHSLLPASLSSFFVHASARRFWDNLLSPGISHANLEELKKALQSALPKQVAVAWTARLVFEGHSVGEKEFGALTDELGLVGGIARAANSVPHIVSYPESASVQISSTWDDDLRGKKPLRHALDTLGTVNKWAEADANGTMVIELCESEAVDVLLDKSQKNNPNLKGLIGHVVLRADEPVDAVYAKGFGLHEERQSSVLSVLIRECESQSESLVETQVKAREMLAAATDVLWRERMQVLLEILRRMVSYQVVRLKLLREIKDAAKYGSASSTASSQQNGLDASTSSKSVLKKFLQPVRKASSNALASFSEKAERRRSSGGAALTEAAIDKMQREDAASASLRSRSLSSTPKNLSRDNSGSLASPASPAGEEESSAEVSQVGASSVAAVSSNDVSPDGPPPPMVHVPSPTSPRTSGSGSGSEKKTPSRRKVARRKGNRGSVRLSSSSSIGGGSAAEKDQQYSSGSMSHDSDVEATQVDEVFSSLFEQLHKAQAALQAREAQLKLREGRLRAKKRALVKRETAALSKLDAMRLNLDEREAMLTEREAALEARMRQVTRLKKEDHMRALTDEFSENPERVIPLQRAVRALLCRRSLRNSAKLVRTSEAFLSGRRRNAALFEIFTSEAEHVTRMEQLVLMRKLADEHFTGTKANLAIGLKKVFVGLDEALGAGKVLLHELNVRRLEWPLVTKVSDLFEKWVSEHLPSYKLFINHYDGSVAALQELRTKKAFNDWEVQLLARKLPPIDSLLIVPIQRLPRYRLLLEALEALTSDDHVDKPGLQRVLEQVKLAVADVNAGKGVMEKMQVLLDLDEAIWNLPDETPIVVPGRTLVHRGTLGDALDPRAPQKHYLLFNDCLFELLPRKRGGLLAAAKKLPLEYDFSRALPLSSEPLELREIPPSVMSNGFTIKCAGQWSLDLFAANPQELRGWILAIKGMRRRERAALICTNCATTLINGAERCHVCHKLVLEKSSTDEC